MMKNKPESIKKNSVNRFPFELLANQYQPSSPVVLIGGHWLAGCSKGNLLIYVFPN